MELQVVGHPVPVMSLLALGLGVGFLAGLFGVGGGFLLTPLLHSFLGIPLPVAVGSGLCQMIGAATTALLQHRRLGQSEVRVDVFMLGGTLVGVSAGARLMDVLQTLGDWQLAGHPVPAFRFLLLALYGVLLLLVALYLILEGRRRQDRPEGHGAGKAGPLARCRLPPYIDLPVSGLKRVSVPVLAYLGLGLGLLSGLLGIGGGVALRPVLLYGVGLPMRIAAGTGILMLAVTAVSGTVVHAVRGNVHLGLAVLLLIGSTVGAQLGARATSVLPVGRLKAGFAGVVLLTMGVVVWEMSRLFGGD